MLGQWGADVDEVETFEESSFLAENEFVIHTYSEDYPMIRVVVEPAARPDDRDPWGEDPEWPRKDWARECSENDTSLGYWDWVDSQKEAHDE